MKSLVIKLCLFLIICLTIISFLLFNFGGNIDYFYEKFTTPKTKSMIIGDSRSFQGIQPSIINEYFKNSNVELPMFNYSFTIAQAIIGPLYNKSILKKLDKSTKNGLFIISITPQMLTEHDGYSNINGEFREQGQPPHNMIFVDVNPNYEYFFKNLSFFHFKAMFRKSSTTHKDGWLEETNLPRNEKVFEEWKSNGIEVFLKEAKKASLSNTRIESLHELINQLKEKGNVYLLRMPISNEYYGYEEKYFPEINKILDSISKLTNVDYFNFNNIKNSYGTYDGHHLNKFDGKIFSKDLCDLIQSSLLKKETK
ncbi:hypothetical protein L3X39_09025 [Sabulilitoribacter multivorans]|uniref:SGNH/GDSL hydrolase family protein n=1 Tax=Flaviramulus multivorans TaxID=1304750 RepID=A0ABS9IJJ9_9FLAO|nr:hypothetical protein [Flaviramulus multivorans]MCF7560779.1 hypothetical protein [Flaviramulus multivorans]